MVGTNSNTKNNTNFKSTSLRHHYGKTSKKGQLHQKKKSSSPSTTETITNTTEADELLAKDCCFISACLDVDEMSMDIGASFRSLFGIVEDEEDDHNSNIHNSNDKDRKKKKKKTISNEFNHDSNVDFDSCEEGYFPTTCNLKRSSYNYNNNNNNRNRSARRKKKSSSSSSSSLSSQPPPVIALSRSSLSTNSDTSTSSSLEATEVDGNRFWRKNHSSFGSRMNKKNVNNATNRSKGSRLRRSGGGSSSLVHKYGHNIIVHSASMNCKDDYDSDVDEYSVEDDVEEECHDQDKNNTIDPKYTAQHEQLINSLFEEAKRRQEQQIQDEMMIDSHAADENANDTNDAPSAAAYHTPPRCPKRPTSNSATKSISGNTLTSDKSCTSKTSRYSRTSNYSGRSSTSELLTPSSHRFQNSLKGHRKNGFARFRRRNYFSRLNPHRKGNGGSYDSTTALISSKNRHNSTSARLFHQTINNRSSPATASDFSACSNSTSSPASYASSPVHTFLDKNVKLQKDSGSGSTIGSSISANGRDAAMRKLNDKMDVLAEVDRDGKWANARLTRIPAKDMTFEQKEVGLYTGGYVETRSMLAIKLGFVSLKYGILVHWNVRTGLAELVLLRKSSPESFMKIVSSKKKKGKGKNVRRSKRSQSQKKKHGVCSVDNSAGCDSLEIEPTASSPM